MMGIDEQRKSDRIEAIIALAKSRAGSDVQAKAGAEAFLRRFYANAAPGDIVDRAAEELYGAGLALWNFGRQRQPGEARVRVFTPRMAEHGWQGRHSVVQIVNDDMPFLVDSITAELNRRNLTVHLLVHPVVRVARDAFGVATQLVEPGANGASGALAESFMHVEIDEFNDSQRMVEIERALVEILGHVRAAVSDWRAMRAQIDSALGEFDRKPPPVAGEEIAAARDFLRWLASDNFTFLAYREYDFEQGAGELAVRMREDAGLGLGRDPKFVIFDTLRPVAQDFIRRAALVRIAKANRRSPVHRPAYMDAVSIKRFGANGEVVGERLFVGLFTSTAYQQRPREIPLLREKVAAVLARTGYDPASHDGKALLHILETFPRDELFQSSLDELHATALGILHLQERQRIALFTRRDPFGRFVSALVYVPRDRFDTALRIRFHEILAKAYRGRMSAFYTQLSDDSPLMRVHYIVGTNPGEAMEVRTADVERELVEAGRDFSDRLQEALVSAQGEEIGLRNLRRYARAFPTAYREHFQPAAAVSDIARLDQVANDQVALAIDLYRMVEDGDQVLRLKIGRKDAPVPLSDILPMLENMGVRAISETPYRIAPSDPDHVLWMQDFELRAREGVAVDLKSIKPGFEATLAALWAGAVENDGFNRLVLLAGLGHREVATLRAFARYLRQAGIPFSLAYMEDALARHPKLARLLVELFRVLHDPAARQGADMRASALVGEAEQLLDSVTNLDDDRILRRYLNVVRAVQRTNAFQTGADGAAKPYISFKIDSQAIDDLPLPRPLVEIFVYSPRVEAIHLRGGRVARGGIRWSDRREDFRTEILGLMKAQMVKNAVIVPVGSKGGFVVKRPPPAEAGREAFLNEGIACYQTMMRGLLDVTDNLGPSGVVPPRDLWRRDGDDPYLVVAADKGTASFSDIANRVSLDYGFWLGDAFASGGSAGYDHKKMGITARGAWEAVKRHFRELGHDTQTTDFTVVGVGDMSGDVFGNGMLRSRHIKLLGAFDHRHIFVDPDPDPERSFVERERMFALPRSSWADYDAALISQGGGVFDRKAKSIKLTPAIKACFKLSAESVTPAELMKAMLKAPVDLLWLGGIGTYVKASGESHAEAGDRANDTLRVDAKEIAARVVGEGANLGLTQRARIEYAQSGAGGAGGRINTDAIDNSAGVDTSDHEVNIKILLGDVLARGDMTLKQRDQLLAEMTDEVAALVLRDNYMQTQALSVAQAQGHAALDRQIRLIRALEKSGRLNRAIEFLPDDEELARRQAAKQGLTRPELAVLLAYAKIALYDALLASDLPDDSYMAQDLERYFPTALGARHKPAIERHRLRREIIATVATNSLVNRAGLAFVNEIVERTGAGPVDVARAYLVTRQVFALRPLWAAIEQLDNRVPATVQYRMLNDIGALLEAGTQWFLRHSEGAIDIAQAIDRYAPAIADLAGRLGEVLDGERAKDLARRVDALERDGVPAELARAFAGLADLLAAPALARIALAAKADVAGVAKVYFAIGARLGFDWLRAAAGEVMAETAWQQRAVTAVIDDLDALQAELTGRAITAAGGLAGVGQLATAWTERNRAGLQRFDALLAELRMAAMIDVAALTVALRELRALAG